MVRISKKKNKCGLRKRRGSLRGRRGVSPAIQQRQTLCTGCRSHGRTRREPLPLALLILFCLSKLHGKTRGEEKRLKQEVMVPGDTPPPPPTRPKLPPQLSQEKILHLNAQGKNISECMHQAALAAGRNRVSLWKNREGFKIQT